jgi:outer membrane receptor protein involved in Fe transport
MPEKVYNYEFSINKSLIGNTLNTELSLYRSLYSNSLESIKTSGNKDQYVNSSGIGMVYGGQISIKYIWNKRFDFYVNSTFNKSYLIDESNWNKNIDTTYTTADIAMISYNFGAGMYLFNQKAHFQIMGNYVGQKLTGPGTTISDNLGGNVPAFFLLNSSVNFDIFKNFNFQFRINNILDVKYYSPGVFAGTGAQSSNIPQPFRNFNISMNFTF